MVGKKKIIEQNDNVQDESSSREKSTATEGKNGRERARKVKKRIKRILKT